MDVEGMQTNPTFLVKQGILLNEASEGQLGNVNSLHTPPRNTSLILVEDDYNSDLFVAQPLQDMNFLTNIGTSGDGYKAPSGNEGLLLLDNGHVRSCWEVLEETNLHDNQADTEKMDADFPPLNREQFTKKKEKSGKQPLRNDAETEQVDHQTTTGDARSTAHTSHTQAGKNKMGPRPNHGGTTEATKENSTLGKKLSLVEILKAKEQNPIIFEPDKLKKIGIVGESSGVPSIYFSGSDTAFLAEQLGYAIVGKFSHSIPSSQHLQRALQGMHFAGEYSWRYINAKHVLIQFKLLSDYAKLLSGPNGMPVWFIDRHPMRVFKWTPEFDPFFESPIAAVWCNLIGLPIHLYEKSALFAIGNLLGTPIQADHATIAKTRLSFARLCIEIDISMPPTEEIVLDLQGREVRQKVKWDRIPHYCRDCKHVGHTQDTCYANGQREKPMKRDYNTQQPRWQSHGDKVTGSKGESSHKGRENILNQMGRQGTSGHAPNSSQVQEEKSTTPTESHKASLEEASFEHDEGGFHKQGRRRRHRGRGRGRGWSRSSSLDRDLGALSSKQGEYGNVAATHSEEGSPKTDTSHHDRGGGTFVDHMQGTISNPKYFRMLPNGDFDTEHYEDENDWEMEEDNEEDFENDGAHPPDKRELALEGSKVHADDGTNKKVRLEALVNTPTC